MMWRGLNLKMSRRNYEFGVVNGHNRRNTYEKLILDIAFRIRCFPSYRYDITCNPLTFMREES